MSRRHQRESTRMLAEYQARQRRQDKESGVVPFLIGLVMVVGVVAIVCAAIFG